MNTKSNQTAVLLRAATLSIALEFLLPAVAPAQVGVAWMQPTAGVSIALDSADNVYTLNYAYALGAEMILTKRDANGTLVWETWFDQTDTTKWERASWVATDSAGNAIVCGTYMSGYSNPVEAASIVMKFDPAGNVLWRKVYESSFDGSSVKKCLVDPNDDIYVLGMGSGPSGYVTKVKKFAFDGTEIWSWFDSAGIGAAVNFKFTPDGFIAITGRSIFGSINGYAKIGLDASTVWSYPGVFSLTVGDCAGDAFGNTYLVHGEYVSNGGTVIKKLDPSGVLAWENVYGLSGFRVEVGSDNRVIVSGFPNSGTPGAAFIKVDENGGLVWSNLDADGSLGLLLHAHMLLDDANNAYLAAGTLGAMAVCRVNSDGTTGWTQSIQGGNAYALALGNTDDSVYVVGGSTVRLGQGGTPTLPAAPSGLTSSALTATSVSLRWTDNSGNETGFTIDRCTGTLALCGANPGSWSPIATTAANVSSHTDTGLSAGATYTWRVSAFNSVGRSGYSNFFSLATPANAPAAPTNLSAQPRLAGTKVKVRLQWTDNATNETRYIVERCTGSTCTNFVAVASLPVNTVLYTDGTVTRATSYRYRVAAGGSSGNSPYSNIVKVTTR